MQKIKTIFERDWEGNRGVVDNLLVDPELLFNATATEKIDGTNVRLTVRNHTLVRLEKRRNPDKIQKHKGIEEPWYIDAFENEPADKWIWDAAKNTDIGSTPDGEWSAEAVGPDIQGNPLNLTTNRIYIFSLPEIRALLAFQDVPHTFNELREWLPKQKSRVGVDAPIEGIVWHCPDGQMFKIKTKDFK